MNLQLCSATLTTLYLEGVHLDTCFSKLWMSPGSASSMMKVLAKL